ncbi:MAG: diacylglycerol kinase family protein [Bacteroidia bacterium]|jgi:diacylglycerol kinase|nr:diacylglycerol kinase family protein [Bacteroidia bacterium]
MNKVSRLQSRLRSFGFAWNGLVTAFKSQSNLQIHAVAALVVLGLGYYVSLNAIEWCMVLVCIALVTSAELINTAIETYIDYKSPEHHAEIGKAKDIAAAAVWVCALFAAIVGSIVFIPKLFPHEIQP